MNRVINAHERLQVGAVDFSEVREVATTVATSRQLSSDVSGAHASAVGGLATASLLLFSKVTRPAA